MDGTRVIIGENNSTPNVNNTADSSIKPAGTHRMSVHIGDTNMAAEDVLPKQASVTSAAHTDSQEPLSTLRTQTGDPIIDMKNVNSQSTIQIGGVEMTIGNAAHLGYLQLNNGEVNLTQRGEQWHSARMDNILDKEKARLNEKHVQAQTTSEQIATTAAQILNRGGAGAQAAMTDAIESLITQDRGSWDNAYRDLCESAQITDADGFLTTYTNQAVDSLVGALENKGYAGDSVREYASEKIPARELSQLIFGFGRGDTTVIDYIENRYMAGFRAWVARNKE